MKEENIFDILSRDTQHTIVSSLSWAIKDNYGVQVTSRMTYIALDCLELRAYFHTIDSERDIAHKLFKSLSSYRVPVKSLFVKNTKFLTMDKNLDIGRKDIIITFPFKIHELNQNLSLSMNKELFK